MNMQNRPFILIKITADKYIDALKSGKLYMRRLKEFRDDEVNPARTDQYETLISTNPNSSVDFLKQIYCGNDFKSFKSMVTNVGFYDERCAYYNVFCMYSLEIDEDKKFIKPDEKLYQFINEDNNEPMSAVIIYNSNEFMSRVTKSVEKNFSNTFFKAERVNYDIDFSKEKVYYVFSKLPKYLYQNEFRICIDLYKGEMPLELYNRCTDYAKLTMPPVKISKEVYKDYTLEIGDISDICFSVPLKEFVEFDGVEEKIKAHILK